MRETERTWIVMCGYHDFYASVKISLYTVQIKNHLHISSLALFYRFFPFPRHTVPSGLAGTQCSCRLASPGRLARTVWRRLSCSRNDTHPRIQSDTPAHTSPQSSVVHSHWSRLHEARLSLVECCSVSVSYAIKNQFVASKSPY